MGIQPILQHRQKKYSYKRWSKLPYAGETKPPAYPVTPDARTWPLYYLTHNRIGHFDGPQGKRIPQILSPNLINWTKQLKVVRKVLHKLTPHQIAIAKYWGAGPATKQWVPILDILIDTYSSYRIHNPIITPTYAGRILATTHAAMNDTFVVTWQLKYQWDVARPNQIDPQTVPILCTPVFPAYPSGHAAIAGCAEAMLSYFFPAEKERLKQLAQEAAQSRLYAGVHFPVDNQQGLKLGRQIGKQITQFLATQIDGTGKPIDQPLRQRRSAKLPPPQYEQVIPYSFSNYCSSKIKKVSP
ncbi:vanadium-dependent haloperoxidase [Hazenella sp. IB182357]|uniref:Vanadium-dependent haloperoxidase n=1 Tax=Polycladospora coralii TaxID=2771432 RepID=A0A926NDL1_9BACL|nr:vanadium-dependent haloperoxidase [Polycladospora coralii]MBD1371619.1 vanadium-dependent haloperoxidase [Polycladospora coralii]